MQESGKFYLTKWLEKKISLSLENKLVFNDGFQFLNVSLNSLDKNSRENDFKYTSQ